MPDRAVKQAYAAYDSDPRVSGPDDRDAFVDAVTPLMPDRAVVAISEDTPIEHYQDGRDMAMRHQGRWYLWRNIAEPDEDETWACWYVSVPDTGQDGPAALDDLWRRGS